MNGNNQVATLAVFEMWLQDHSWEFLRSYELVSNVSSFLQNQVIATHGKKGLELQLILKAVDLFGFYLSVIIISWKRKRVSRQAELLGQKNQPQILRLLLQLLMRKSPLF